LSARDREAVLMRFFQGWSFGEIGAALGLSDEAARKRIERALEKLRDGLRPHGIASTSTALATLLASQTISAAPAGLLANVTGVALSTSGGAATGIITFITMTKLQAGIAAAVILAGVAGLITQHRTIATLRENAIIAQERLAQLDPNNTTADKARGRVRTAPSNLPGTAIASAGNQLRPAAARGELLAETSAALQYGKVPERNFALVAALQKLSRDNWREVLQAFEEERKRTGLGHPEVFEIFVRRAGEVAGKDVVSYFLQSGWVAGANEAMIGWASKNPTEALQWLGREADVETRHNVMGAAIRGLALTEPDLAVKTLEEQPMKERNKYANELVTSMLRTIGLDGAQRLVEGMITRAAESGSLKEDYLKHVFYDYSMLRIAQSAANGTIADAVAWVNQHVGQPYVDHRIIEETTARLAGQNPQETFRWLERVNTTLLQAGDDSTAGYRALLSAWAKKEGAPAVETWLQSQASHPHYDHLAWQYAALVAEQDSVKATKWANTIKDPTIKQGVLQVISKRAPKGKS
jgi:hypothetical protein